MDKTKEYSLVAALRDFFELLPGQGLADFLKEVKELNTEDRAYFRTHLDAIGYKIKA